MDFTSLIIALTAGALLDRLFGDPVRLPHPVVWFGKAIAFMEHRLNKGDNRHRNGLITSVSLTAGVYIITAVIVTCAFALNYWLGTAVTAIGVFYCLAGKTLEDEVAAVFHAADRSLEAGRKQVSRIVGRDTSELSDHEVRTAALETLAENLSDGVVAPLFWYLILGLPGMMAYKMINTLDSMIGYKTDRYLEFGAAAAKTDDAANYIPARLTALLMIMSSPKKGLVSFVSKYSSCHASPNSGYPESAMAGILNCRFGGPHNYFGILVYKPYIGDNNRKLTSADMKESLRVSRITEALMLIIMFAILISLTL